MKTLTFCLLSPWLIKLDVLKVMGVVWVPGRAHGSAKISHAGFM